MAKEAFAELSTIKSEDLIKQIDQLRSKLDNAKRNFDKNPQYNFNRIQFDAIMNDFENIEKLCTTMIKTLSVKQQELTIDNLMFQNLNLEQERKKIEIESYPVPIWPKLLFPIGTGLLPTASLIASYFGEFNIYSILTFSIGLIIMFFSLWMLGRAENKKMKLYKKLFNNTQ